MSNNQLIASFRSDLELKGQSMATIKTHGFQAVQFLRFLDGKDVSQVAKDDLKSYLAFLRSKHLTNRTISLYFSSLSVFFDYLQEEEIIENNLVRHIQKRYLRAYKPEKNERHIISVKDAVRLVNSIINTRDKTMILLLFKTGIRRKELIGLDLDDVNFGNMSFTLKPTPKRSNRLMFLDDETSAQLKRWLRARESWQPKDKALFINRRGLRLNAKTIEEMVEKYAANIGLHDPSSKKPEERFSPHCCRHWAVTHLLRAGMPREYVKWLRGDAMREAVDLYNHIDSEDVKQSYLSCIPKFGI